MKTVQEFKKLLRLNKLVSFEELDLKSKQFLEQMGYTTEYQNLIKKQELPSKIAIKHYKKVAQYLNTLSPLGNYSEDLTLWSHFPKIPGSGHCSREIQKGYTEISMEMFENFIKKYPNGQGK